MLAFARLKSSYPHGVIPCTITCHSALIPIHNAEIPLTMHARLLALAYCESGLDTIYNAKQTKKVSCCVKMCA